MPSAALVRWRGIPGIANVEVMTMLGRNLYLSKRRNEIEVRFQQTMVVK